METRDPGVPGPAEQGPPEGVLSGPQKLAATIMLAIGLMAIGGVAVVSAASPDPSASAAPSASSGSGSPGASGGTSNANCPNM